MSGVLERGTGLIGIGASGSGASGAVPPSGLAARPSAGVRGRAGAWVLVIAAAALTAVLYVTAVIPATDLATEDRLYWWPLVAGLMWAAEIAVVRLGVGGRPVTVPLVVVPTVIAFYHLAPSEIVLARVVGSGLVMAVRHRRFPLRFAMVMVGVAAGTSVGVLAFQAEAPAAPPGMAGLLASSYAGAATMVVTGTLIDALFARATHSVATGGVRRTLLVGLATAFVGTSFAVVAVVFLDTQPGDLWALAAPAAVGVLGYRAYSLQRGREARLEFLYDCSQILQSPELDADTLARVVARTQTMFRTATVEVILAPGPEPGTLRRCTVDACGVARCDVVDHDTARVRRELLGNDGLGRHLGRDQLGLAGVIDERVGMIVAVRGADDVVGTLLVADRLDDLQPFGTEDLRALVALGTRLGLVAVSTGLAGDLAASVGRVRKLAAIVQSSEDAIAAIDTSGRITAWNPAATRLFGYEAEEIVGRLASDVLPDAERARVRDSFAAALAGAPVNNVRMEWRRRDGGTVPISITISPIRGDADAVTGASAIVRDETDRRRAEAAAAASAAQLRTVIDGSPLGMGTAGPDNRWIQVNPALCTLLGLAIPEIVGRPVAEMIHPDDRTTVRRLEGLLFEGDAFVRSVERRYVARDGRVVWTQVTARRLDDSPAGESIALYTVEDITERRTAEERTRVTEERFRRAALAISSAHEPSRVIRALLESARDTLGAQYAAVAIYSEDGAKLLGIHGSGGDAAALEAHLGRVIDGNDILSQARMLGRPIRLRDLHVRAGRAAPAPGGCPVTSLLSVPLGHGSPGSSTLYLANKIDADEFGQGDEAIGVALATHAAVCLENAQVNAHVAELVLELDQANEELLRANEAKTRFLAAVAHELRAPLHAIVVAADLVDDPPAGPLTPQEIKGFGLTIQSSGRHMVRLIDDLSDLARIEAGRMDIRLANVELDGVLGEVATSLAAAAQARGVVVELPRGPAREVVADPARLRQILTNLVGNAIKFTDRGGRVWVEVGTSRSSTRIAVHDTGIGIRGEDLERAFLPFQQVSRHSTPGAGLGLAISRSLAELHGGRLEASSELGVGSAFTLTLPRRPRGTARPPGPATEGRTFRRIDGAGQPILVVEDDPTALALATSVLQMVGYEVWTATGLEAARRWLDRAVPALMLVDVRLGDGSGLDLIRWARSQRATQAVPILVVSADTMPDDVRRAREAGCDGFLPKPLRPRMLLSRIEELMQGVPESAVTRP